jgi:hypothetical protein
MGSTFEGVRDAYGDPVETRTLELPIGTRYADRVVSRESYRVRGGSLVVTYVDGIARALETDSPRYGTTDGIRVGRADAVGEMPSAVVSTAGFVRVRRVWERVDRPRSSASGRDRHEQNPTRPPKGTHRVARVR